MINNACRVLYHVITQTVDALQTAAINNQSGPDVERLGREFGAAVELFMKSEGLMLRLIALVQSNNPVLMQNAIIVITVMLKVLSVEHVSLLVVHFKLVEILVAQLGFVFPTSDQAAIRKYCDITKCLLELVLSAKKDFKFTSAVMNIFVNYTTIHKDSELQRVGREILNALK